MPRVFLPSKQGDGSPNWVDLRDPDDFWAEELFALHRAVRIKSNANGETEYSGDEIRDDKVNAFLGAAITAWSFPVPIPSQVNVAAPDRVIGRAMKSRDWGALRIAATPLMNEMEGEGLPDPKSGAGAADTPVPVPAEPAG